MAEKWAKTSLPPSSGVMKPKPLSALNHLTVPVAIVLLWWTGFEDRTLRTPVAVMITYARDLDKPKAPGSVSGAHSTGNHNCNWTTVAHRWRGVGYRANRSAWRTVRQVCSTPARAHGRPSVNGACLAHADQQPARALRRVPWRRVRRAAPGGSC